ncbi:hypothetical protein DPMN_005096 [Dreissena polymorpha]|uniref:Uncharacterized protein n=1 Tax=Dreissena polymorpha TaxID=45954 RepID=A0A9D4RW85_DREPO|nr:hypothetical protein DPMN_005096 [Dreissena polymorpha]
MKCCYSAIYHCVEQHPGDDGGIIRKLVFKGLGVMDNCSSITLGDAYQLMPHLIRCDNQAL